MVHLCAKCSEVHNGDQRRCGEQHNAPPWYNQQAALVKQSKRQPSLVNIQRDRIYQNLQ
jgi:hypothetical protein